MSNVRPIDPEIEERAQLFYMYFLPAKAMKSMTYHATGSYSEAKEPFVCCERPRKSTLLPLSGDVRARPFSLWIRSFAQLQFAAGFS